MTKGTKNTKTENPKFKGYIKAMWLIVVAGLLAVPALLIMVSFSKLPDTQELENPKYEYSTRVFSDELEELGRIFKKNRDQALYEDLSPYVVQALVATEDERFFDHSGIDLRSFMRAMLHFGANGGGSTITQQLAKQFFTKGSKNIVRRIWQKLQEWIIAIEFEKRYTKEEIIAMYLNKYDFLNDANGISAASTTYFGKPHGELKIEEAASLVGMLKNPRIYNPLLYPENAQKRREVVLNQMKKKAYISNSEYDSLRVLPLDMSAFNRSVHYSGPAPYFIAELQQELRKVLDQPQYTKAGGGKYDIYKDGLKIYTTIDLKMQEHAEAAMKSHMKRLQERYFTVWKNLDPWDYKADKAQKNQRYASLKSAVEDSERYQKIRNQQMNAITQDIAKDIENVRLWDADIRRLKEAEKDKKYLKSLMEKNYITTDQKEVYEQILASEHWNKLKDTYAKFQSVAQSEFAKKVEMKVFAYNASGEKDTIMSPLDSIKYHQMHMQLGSVSIDPHTGYIKTWIGGIGHKYFQYDHVNANRQVGSTFKPFIYATAIYNLGISPCWKVKDEQYTIPAGDPDFGLMNTWTPSNSKPFTGQEFTLKECLKQSLNSASVWLIKQLGNVQLVKDLVENMGIDEDKIPNAPSIALGTPELTVMDMTGAYSTFANNGIYIEPTYIKRIEDKDGNVIYSPIQKESVALNPQYNYVMVDMLKYATSSVQPWLDVSFGGKTGTTNDHVDGWFMGITPDLVVGTWVGGNQNWIRFLSLADGAGSHMARPYFKEFMQRVERDPKIAFDSQAQFAFPEGDLGVEIDCSVYEHIAKPQPNASAMDEEEF